MKKSTTSVRTMKNRSPETPKPLFQSVQFPTLIITSNTLYQVESQIFYLFFRPLCWSRLCLAWAILSEVICPPASWESEAAADQSESALLTRQPYAQNSTSAKNCDLKCFLPGVPHRNIRNGRGFLFHSMLNTSEWVVMSRFSGTICIPCIKHSNIPRGVFKDRPDRTKSFYSTQRLKKQG